MSEEVEPVEEFDPTTGQKVGKAIFGMIISGIALALAEALFDMALKAYNLRQMSKL